MGRTSPEDYAREFDSVYNESPWVAEAVVVQRPFATVEALASTMPEAVEHSVEQEHSEALRQIHLIAKQRLLGFCR